MRIYTRTGDTGHTGLIGGERVAKSHLLLQAIGDLDELNCSIGVALTHHPVQAAHFTRVQNLLFELGAELAGADPKVDWSFEAARLEGWIDENDVDLEPLRAFILPGGCPAAAAIHLSRSVCRRAERSLVFAASEREMRPETIVFVNRLSDWMFSAARTENLRAGIPDIEWTKS